jgi:hypothetical protein
VSNCASHKPTVAFQVGLVVQGDQGGAAAAKTRTLGKIRHALAHFFHPGTNGLLVVKVQGVKDGKRSGKLAGKASVWGAVIRKNGGNLGGVTAIQAVAKDPQKTNLYRAI